MLRSAILSIAFILTAIQAHAAITLAPLFSDGAVLQRGKLVPVWGQGDAGEKVTVEFHGQKKLVTAGNDGHWSVSLDPMLASADPADLVVTGSTIVQVHNVLVGEVWICAGQSNMALQVLRANNYKEEAEAAEDPLLRMFKVKLTESDTPAFTVSGSWIQSKQFTVGIFSAVGYYFARELRKKLGVPVGMVDASWGGTPVESWMSGEALKSDPDFGVVATRWQEMLGKYPAKLELYQKRAALPRAEGARAPVKPQGPGSRLTPSGLFNGMVNPLIPYALQGVIWYQGEANAGRAAEYPKLFAAMITQWRHDFGQGDFPFYFVQLANFVRKIDRTNQQWAFQRESQATALSLPKTGMAVAADIGEANNLHPKNKQEVGRRLALIALSQTYGRSGEFSGPVFKAAIASGGGIRVTFTNADGLKLKDGTPTGLELAGKDEVFHPATGKIDGTAVVVTSPEVASPVYIRYGWDNNPAMTIYNGADLPAPAFRTDKKPTPLNGRVVAEPDAAATPEGE